MNKEAVTKEIEKYETLIDITKKTRESAIAARTASQTKIEMSLETLKKKGVTPETAESEIAKIDSEIERLLKELGDSIPMELLAKLKRI